MFTFVTTTGLEVADMDIAQIGVLVRNARGAFKVRFRKGAKWTFGTTGPTNTGDSRWCESVHQQGMPLFDREAVS